MQQRSAVPEAFDAAFQEAAAAATTNGSVGNTAFEDDIFEPVGLPKGWTGRLMTRSSGRVDKYYFSPSGQKFRSESEVHRHLLHNEYLPEQQSTKASPPLAGDMLVSKLQKFSEDYSNPAALHLGFISHELKEQRAYRAEALTKNFEGLQCTFKFMSNDLNFMFACINELITPVCCSQA